MNPAPGLPGQLCLLCLLLSNSELPTSRCTPPAPACHCPGKRGSFAPQGLSNWVREQVDHRLPVKDVWRRSFSGLGDRSPRASDSSVPKACQREPQHARVHREVWARPLPGLVTLPCAPAECHQCQPWTQALPFLETASWRGCTQRPSFLAWSGAQLSATPNRHHT